ncbi:MAG: membrane protein insertion efficiency factor YidD [Bacteriovoracaceae bacterium]|nr:membrane protein insertion efficiency factor YidD [Bacteriovoracaceae bacterium]
MKKYILKLIEWYQSKGGGSELLGIDCVFSPTCSQYTKEAIQKYGLIKGGFLGSRRILRCRDHNSNFICIDKLD